MPRIPTSLILRAYRRDPLLPVLLKECRSLDSAQNELRWLREKAINDFAADSIKRQQQSPRGTEWRRQLKSMCFQRARGKPLQYILGDQPFGDLEILCRKGVLIPRVETELYTFHAVDLILNDMGCKYSTRAGPLRILDLCTGSGCISLLLHALLAPHVKDLTIMGIDVSTRAIKLAQKNLEHNLKRGLLSGRARNEVLFRRADVLGLQDIRGPKLEDVLSDLSSGQINESGSSILSPSLCWDVLISNPPYISPSDLKNGTTARSVRVYEPTLALVPPLPALSDSSELNVGDIERQDTFYPRLLSLAFKLGTRLAILECGDLAQAQRVVCMAQTLASQLLHSSDFTINIWQPYPQDDNDLSGARAVILRRCI
ncbi:hypothetical protein VTN77DRAFT_8643 [Rasamsonia byssochlamydoides]|uniref:uncharacterized protein n=1 Tax=Rasamsonia byssochlamydoides TaxID=89139 RepID=UPI003744668F